MMDRISICEALIKRNEIDLFLKWMVTGDEKWITYCNIVQKRLWSKCGEVAQMVAKPGLSARKNCRKEDLRIVALQLGETVAEKVTIVELTEIIKENKYFKEDVEFVKELIQYMIEDLKRVQEDRKKEAESRL
ncbi:hypothetical protein TNCV_4912351 [Trichonephila clavipes]|nr:hypothetical protein TNCV_4912351 [Trichonephila clavipes]